MKTRGRAWLSYGSSEPGLVRLHGEQLSYGSSLITDTPIFARMTPTEALQLGLDLISWAERQGFAVIRRGRKG